MTLVKPGLKYIIRRRRRDASSHKNGFLYEQGWADNDIGIVWSSGRASDTDTRSRSSRRTCRGKYDDIPVAQQIAALAYQWFVGRYGYP